MNRRVAVFATTFPPPFTGGAERSTKEVVDSLISAGFEVRIFQLISPGQKQERNSCQKYEILDLPVRNLYHPLDSTQQPHWKRALWHLRNIFSVGTAIQIGRIFFRWRPASILCHNITGITAAPWVVARILHIPLVQIIHDYALACPTAMMWKAKTGNCVDICFKCQFRRASTRALWPGGRVIYVSDFVRTRMTKLGVFNASKTSASIGFPAVVSESAYAVSRGDTPRRFEVGFIGRVEPEKGVENLLDACASLGIGAAIAGNCSPEYQARLESRYPGAFFLGHVDVKQFARECRLICLPSLWHEPFGRIPIELSGEDSVMVLSKLGGLPEAASLSSLKYLLVDPNDISDIASKIAAALGPPPTLWQQGNPSAGNCKSLADEVLRCLESVSPTPIP